MKTLFLGGFLAAVLFTIGCSPRPQDDRPRLLVTTDIGGDPDDQQSLLRLLVTSNKFEIEGLIASASGTPGELDVEVIKPHLIEEMVDAYARVEGNLRLHSTSFPHASYLKSVIKKGNPRRGWDNVGEGHDTEASEWIIQCVDKEDPRPLNIAIWGGQTDVAQALWKVKNSRTSEEYNTFVSKIRIYDIADQDRIFNKIWETFPGLFYILNKAPQGQDMRNAVFRGMYLGGPEELTSLDWLKKHVIDNHGPLGALYPTKTWTAPNPHGNMKEGDTPSWFYFLKNGMHDPEHPEYGGWGGRFQKSPQGYYIDAADQVGQVNDARATVWRWRGDFQNDFAARMDWCIKPFNDANHAPEIRLNGRAHKYPITIEIAPNKQKSFDLSRSYDPDNDSLSWDWFVYPEMSTLSDDDLLVEIRRTRLIISHKGNKPGAKAHLILKATDNGEPPLTSYQRIIIQVP
jgi:hypothetical protein